MVKQFCFINPIAVLRKVVGGLKQNKVLLAFFGVNNKLLFKGKKSELEKIHIESCCVACQCCSMMCSALLDEC